MLYRANVKATTSAIRRRVETLMNAADSLEDVAKRWNPKGRYFRAQRDLIKISRQLQKDLKPVQAQMTRR